MPGLHQETVGDREQQIDEVNNDSIRMKFRFDVQMEVMKILGYFSGDFEEIADPEKRMLASNDIFYQWVSDGKAAQFAKCYLDIVPPSSDRPKDEVNKVASLVALEMGAELKH